MNILLLARSFFPRIGGAEKYIYRLSEQLSKKGHTVTIFTPNYESNRKIREKTEHVEIYRFPIAEPFGLKSLAGIWIELFKARVFSIGDIIHCFDFETFLWYLPFRLIFPQKPVYITFFGHEGVFPIPRKYILIRKLCEKLSRGNICDGEYIKKWYGTRPDYVTHAAVDIPDIRNKDPENENGATFVGQLRADTGILEYLQALKILRDQHSIKIHLDICGDGPLRDEILRFVEINNLLVTLHGFVENENVVNFFNRNKYAFVSGCNSNLEAMTCRRLVCSIYSNELKKDYLFFRPDILEMSIISDSSGQLAREFVEHHRRPSLVEEKTEKAYKFAIQQSWEKVADTYLKLWRQPASIKN